MKLIRLVLLEERGFALMDLSPLILRSLEVSISFVN
jgi:hypothetical protein